MAKEEETSKKEVAVKEAKLVEVPTQFGEAIQLEDGSLVTSNEFLVRIYNKLIKIEKAVA